MSDLLKRFTADGPKRILSLDGGGIRGAITIGYLKKIEEILRLKSGNKDYRLYQYFDLIGGTSTGSIIATALAIGMEVDEIEKIYLKLGKSIFEEKTGWFQMLRNKFKHKALVKALYDVLGDTTLGSDTIKTGLCIVAKRYDTGSTWPLLNNPKGKYYRHNKGIFLRNAVRASSAAPTYFEPEEFEVGNGELAAFVDGGVSMDNNPALLLFLVSTLSGFHFNWKKGEKNLFLCSIGTGRWELRKDREDTINNNILEWATEIPSILMNDACTRNEVILQLLSNSPTSRLIDREMGDLKKDLITKEPALSYLRFNAVLETNELQSIGVTEVDLASLREMSESKNVKILMDIGKKLAENEIKEEYFDFNSEKKA